MPKHIALVMDGNRRWAQSLGLPVAVGHASGARRVRSIVQACADRGVQFLTLFAFSTENWTRAPQEVGALMNLLTFYLQTEVKDMKAKGVRLVFAGSTEQLEPKLQALLGHAQASTAHNTTITLTIAFNYGGRWDILQAVRAWQADHPGQSADALDEKSLGSYLAIAHAPDPDLLIRTGGESRLSNFMLWQTAYTELFFSDVHWPSFDAHELEHALSWYGKRQRRFGGSAQPWRPASMGAVPRPSSPASGTATGVPVPSTS